MPARAGRAGPEDRGARRRRAVLAVRGSHLPQRRSQRRGRSPLETPGAWTRHGSTRCDPVVTTSTPVSPTWTSTGCGPRCASRLWWPGSAARSSRSRRTPSSAWPSMRAWNRWHAEVWAGAHPRPDHRPATSLARRHRRRHRGDPPQRRPRLQGGELPGVPGPTGRAVDLLRCLGPVLRGVPGDLDRRVSAHRCIGLGTVAVPGPALRAVPDAVPRERLAGRGGVVVVGRAPALPGSGHRHVRRGDRLGADAARPGRLRARAFGVGVREHVVALRAPTQRGPTSQLLVLHHR